MLVSRRTVLSLLVVAVTALAVGASSAAQAKPYTIVPGKWTVKRLGPFKTQNTRHYRPTVGRAIRAFGRPSSRFQKQGGCVVKWKRLGLRIEFWNFGGTPPGQTICSDDVGLAQSFNVTERKFRTWRGLRVGMRESRLRRLHPAADWFDGPGTRRLLGGHGSRPPRTGTAATTRSSPRACAATACHSSTAGSARQADSRNLVRHVAGFPCGASRCSSWPAPCSPTAQPRPGCRSCSSRWRSDLH